MEPTPFSLPPMTTVGSSPPRAKTEATIEVVVVLPWAPAIATLTAELLADPARRARMGDAIRALARPDAAARIVDRLFELAGRPERQAA